MRLPAFSFIALLLACGSSGALSPVMPTPAILDVFDQTVLEHTAGVAPTFPEAAEPRDETVRRFRGWLGWAPLACLSCDADAGPCPPCTGAYVCQRPSRVVPCQGEEIVTQSVTSDPPVPTTDGVYVFEGAWIPRPPSGALAFEVTRVLPVEEPPKEP